MRMNGPREQGIVATKWIVCHHILARQTGSVKVLSELVLEYNVV